MNDEIAITVSTPDTGSRTYVFSEQPVMVGRSPECHISICHQAVPRNLCSAWLEDTGAKVRVEENPGLTNPLLHGNVPVAGGVTGKRLELSVGPIALLVEKASNHNREGLSHKRPRRLRLFFAAGAALLAVAALCFSLQLEAGSSSPSFPRIPASPFVDGQLPRQNTSPGGSEQAELLYSRAKALLHSRTGNPSGRVRAARLLTHSIDFLAEESAMEARREEANGIERSIERDYRQEVMELHRHLEKGDEPRAATRAAIVLSYLEDIEFEGRAWLESLAHRSPPGEEVSR